MSDLEVLIAFIGDVASATVYCKDHTASIKLMAAIADACANSAKAGEDRG